RGAQLFRVNEIGLDRRTRELGQNTNQLAMLARYEIRESSDPQPAEHSPQHGIEIVYGEDRLALLAELGAGLEQPIDVLHRRAGVFAVENQPGLVEGLRVFVTPVPLVVF